MKKLLIILAALVLLAASCNQKPQPAKESQPETKTESAQTEEKQEVPNPVPGPSPIPSPAPAMVPPPPPPPPPASLKVKDVTVQANDSGATPATINVAKGTVVNLTINVLTEGTYFAGLEFRGGSVNSGAIAPGSSKTIAFVAEETFTLRAYWPSSGVAKNAAILIQVK